MKNISFMGAVYSDVPAVTLPDAGGGVARFDDASITTATASDVASGKVFLAADGTITTGTSSGGGGSSSWTKVAETSYQVSTTNTASERVATWGTGHSEIYTSDKILYVRIRDTAGKRAGYFYGTDNFFINNHMANVSHSSSFGNGVRQVFYVNSYVDYVASGFGGSTGYGVFADMIYSDGRIRIKKRYSIDYTLTVDSTYKVEVYLLDPPTGAPIFE